MKLCPRSVFPIYLLQCVCFEMINFSEVLPPSGVNGAGQERNTFLRRFAKAVSFLALFLVQLVSSYFRSSSNKSFLLVDFEGKSSVDAVATL